MKYFLQILFISILSLAIINACNNNKNEQTVTSANSMQTYENDTAMTDTLNRNQMDAMSGMLERMKAVGMSGDFDIDFAKLMIEHHQGAVDMSQQYLQQGKNDSLKSMAQAIINDQNREINELKDFISSYKGSGMKHGEGELASSIKEMEEDMPMMSHSGNAEKDYALNMAGHHEQGISMARKELKYGMSGDLKKKAQQTIDKQVKEVDRFKNLAAAH